MESVVIEESPVNSRRGKNLSSSSIHGGSSSSSSAIQFSNGGSQTGITSPPLYSSLPPFRLQQPPLLPLPFSKPAAVRARQRQKKRPPSAASAAARKQSGSMTAVGSNRVDISKGVVDDVEKLFIGVSLYSISPPPSSLPLPTFPLKRPNDGGPTDDLRRLLRL